MNRKQRKRLQKLVNHLNKSMLRIEQLREGTAIDRDYWTWVALAKDVWEIRARVCLVAWQQGIEIDEERMPK